MIEMIETIKHMSPSELAVRFFNLELPASYEDVKSAFRSKAKQSHSDTGGSDEEFIALKAAYDRLMSFGSIIKDRIEQEVRTREGAALSSLGLGLGPRRNGKDCPECQHKGYKSETRTEMGQCRNCNGRGGFRMGRLFGTCAKCQGLGFSLTAKEEVYYWKCWKCDGTGEIEVLNPVIPKWTIGGLSQSGRVKR